MFLQPGYTHSIGAQQTKIKELIHPVSSENTGTNSSLLGLSLLNDDRFIWKPVNDAKISQNNERLDIQVDTSKSDKIFNRASLQTQLSSNFAEGQYPLILSFDYVAESFEGNATFVMEIRDSQNQNILFARTLSSNITNALFLLPDKILNKPIDFRLYVITEEPGSHILAVNDALITTSLDYLDLASNSQQYAGDEKQTQLHPFPWMG